jgi:hypothetical protein
MADQANNPGHETPPPAPRGSSPTEAGRPWLRPGRATFIDSSVVHVLVNASKAVTGREHAVVLQLGTAAIVERVLEIAEIESVLPRAHERQEAVRMIQQASSRSSIRADS